MVVVAGDTVTVPAVATLPTPGDMLTKLASDAVHNRVAEPPTVMVPGDALKAAIAGGLVDADPEGADAESDPGAGAGVGVFFEGTFTAIQPTVLTRSKHIAIKTAIFFILHTSTPPQELNRDIM